MKYWAIFFVLTLPFAVMEYIYIHNLLAICLVSFYTGIVCGLASSFIEQIF